MAEQYTNIRLIMDKLMRHPLLSDLTLETVVDYTVDFMRIVGVPRMFIDRIAAIPIADYKGRIPSDWVDTIMVKYNDKPMRYSTDVFHLSQSSSTGGGLLSNPVIESDALEKITQYLQLHSMDDIAFSDGSTTIQIQANAILKDYPTLIPANGTQNSSGDNTFIIQGNYINTSMRSGLVVMAYRAIAADNEGYPSLPDNSEFTRALMAYIKVQHFTILHDLGKISQNSFSQSQQDYAWAVGACENEFKRLDLSKAEAFFNSYRNLIIRDHEFEQSFRNNGRKENYRR